MEKIYNTLQGAINWTIYSETRAERMRIQTLHVLTKQTLILRPIKH